MLYQTRYAKSQSIFHCPSLVPDLREQAKGQIPQAETDRHGALSGPAFAPGVEKEHTIVPFYNDRYSQLPT